MDSVMTSSSSRYDQFQPKRSRLVLVGAALLIILVLAGSWWFFSRGEVSSAAVGASDGASSEVSSSDGRSVISPNVTVMIPGRQTVRQEVYTNGTIAARREMPIGVAGEGGQIARVLVEPGQWVRAGQTLAVIDRSVQTRQVESLKAQVRVAQADADLAQSELDRAQSLVERGFISKADLDRKTANRDSEAARVRVAQAQLSESRARIDRLDIRAPAAGLVLTRQVEPGQVVSSGSGVLFRLARGGEMEMKAQLAEADLQNISVGTRAVVTPVGTDLKIEGEIWQVEPIINPQTRQGTVRIVVPYSLELRPGGFADARIEIGLSEVPLLPESAILSSPDGNYVYIVGADNRVARKSVTIGIVTDSGVTIASGLTGTEKIVAFAGAFLNVGDTVEPIVQNSAS